MKSLFSSALVVMLFMVAFFIGGCIFDSPKKINNDNTEVQTPNLEDDFGGYKPTDEAPAFGDPEIQNDFGEDQKVFDLLNTDSRITSLFVDSLVDVYFLRITWGRLDGDTTATTVVDWSGSARINKGFLVLLKTIRFDTGDYIHRPRPDKQTIEWTSYTKTHFDGIFVAIVVPPNETKSADGIFTFSTAPFTRSFNYSELDSIDVIYPVGQEGNAISFVGHRKQFVPLPCGNGFLDGRWIKTAKDRGEFMGKWINQDGSLAGHFKGFWGIKNNGEKAFFGKWISRTGAFKGLLKGKWGYSDNEEEGWFSGNWFDRYHSSEGTVEGHWTTGGEKGRKGFLEGKWKRPCP